MYQKSKKIVRVKHSPTLKTIKMVEDVLKNLELYTIKLSDLKRKLPKKVNHNTLKEILRYLEDSGKVHTSIDGITWIYNPSKKLATAIKDSKEWIPGSTSKNLRKFKTKTY